MSIDTVICTHGFWSHGASMVLIKQRLEAEYDYRVLLFSYPSVYGSLDENADSLHAFMQKEGLDSAHIVAHSLGGVVTLRMHAKNPDAPPGRIVCLGSPLTGSRAAEFLESQAWAEPIVGRSITAAVIDDSANSWASEVCARREIGVIAGTAPFGDRIRNQRAN